MFLMKTLHVSGFNIILEYHNINVWLVPNPFLFETNPN